MSEIRVNNITNRDGSTGTTVAGIPVVDSNSHFVVPSGDTAERGSRGRGIIAEGRIGTGLEYITIATLGNATDFGVTTLSTQTEGYALASSTRGLFAGGYSSSPTYSNSIEYVDIQSTGNAFDFGDLSEAKRSGGSTSSSIRGIFYGGIDTGINSSKLIEYVEIASLGNSSEFGEREPGKDNLSGGMSNGVRGVFLGGNTGRGSSPNDGSNTIDYITISTLGNAKDFGDATAAYSNANNGSNSIRGINMGGYTPARVNTIEYITIASFGDAIDFGDLTQIRGLLAVVTNSTRAVACGGNAAPVTTNSNVMDYITIASTGNAADFGDLVTASRVNTACSDSHGGLG